MIRREMIGTQVHIIADGVLVATGPISGNVTLPDGRVIDVTPEYIEMDTQADALAVADAIGRRFAQEGHPDFINDPNVPDDGFVYVGG